MSKCSGLHCPGCGDSGGPGAVIVVLVVLAVLGGAAQAIGQAVSEALFILAVTAASIAGAGVLAGTVAAVVILRRRAVRRPLATRNAPAEIPRLTARIVVPRSARRPELPAARVPGESLADYWERMGIKPRRFPR